MSRGIGSPLVFGTRTLGDVSSGSRVPEPALQAAPRWYRADLGVTIVSSKVSNWANQGTEGSASDFSQGTAGNRPAMGAGLGGQSAIAFALANTSYLGATSPAYTAAHCFMVVKLTNDPTLNVSATDAGFDRTGTGVEPSIPYTDSVIYDEFATSVRKTCNEARSNLANAVRVYERISTSSEWTNLIDGTQVHTTATNTVAWRASTIQLGGSSVAGFYMNGQVAEYIIFSSKRTAGQHAALAAYFNARYGTSCV